MRFKKTSRRVAEIGKHNKHSACSMTICTDLAVGEVMLD